MSDIVASPRPWYDDSMYFDNTCIFDKDKQFIVKLDKTNAVHIVKCVNEYDTLKQENERLKQESLTGLELVQIGVTIDALNQENEKLKEEIDGWKKMYLLKNSK